jgi:hypothetical protein
VVDGALPPGAYSELVTEATEALLERDDLRSRAIVAALRDADAGDRLAHHIGSTSARSRKARAWSVRTARADDRAFWCLGPATYVRHERDRPIAITWRLHHRPPADLYTAFAAAVA